eukprot:403368358
MRINPSTLTLGLALLLGYSLQNATKHMKHLPIKSDPAIDNDVGKSFKQICKENGFAIEQHFVTTSDGYILQIFRVPGFLNETAILENQPVQKPTVLLQHGLGADAGQWIMHRPEVAHAFVLARDGYDVWMGNNRGSQYGLEHETLDPNDPVDKPVFWNFDFEEMGTKDLPATIDYILDQTGQDKLSYVGHSEGTTQFFIGASLDNEYFTKKVNLFVALAPITRIGHTQSSLMKLLASDSDHIEHILINDLGMYDMFPPNWLEQEATEALCSSSFGLPICEGFIELTADLDINVDDLSRINTFLSHTPSGAGYRNFVHYAQIIHSDRFQRYDWGAAKNVQVYNSTLPPLYPLEDLKNIPIALLGGTLDELGSPTDVEWTYETLKPNGNVVFYGQYKLGHLSFAIAKDMTFFTVDTMQLINKYATNKFATEDTVFLQ